jgi:hypothetical protein
MKANVSEPRSDLLLIISRGKDITLLYLEKRSLSFRLLKINPRSFTCLAMSRGHYEGGER